MSTVKPVTIELMREPDATTTAVKRFVLNRIAEWRAINPDTGLPYQTYQKIGDRLGVTKQRVMQLEGDPKTKVSLAVQDEFAKLYANGSIDELRRIALEEAVATEAWREPATRACDSLVSEQIATRQEVERALESLLIGSGHDLPRNFLGWCKALEGEILIERVASLSGDKRRAHKVNPALRFGILGALLHRVRNVAFAKVIRSHGIDADLTENEWQRLFVEADRELPASGPPPRVGAHGRNKRK